MAKTHPQARQKGRRDGHSRRPKGGNQKAGVGKGASGRTPDTQARGAVRVLGEARVPIIILVALILLGVLWFAGFSSYRAEQARVHSKTTKSADPLPPAAAQAAGTKAPATPERRSGFDQEAAFRHLKAQCDFGTRVPGTQEHTRCREYLLATLRPLAARVEQQHFWFRANGGTIRMTNLIARFPADPKTNPRPKAGSGVLLAAHWDTRPTADMETDPERQRKPILGANDGASGVAVLLELARLFKAKPPPVPVWIVLFDGEDYGPGTDRMFLGAKHFARNLPQGVPRQGILLDMVGDRDLEIFKEIYSVERASPVVNSVWETAHRLGYRAYFHPEPKHAVLDDHLPLLDKGIAMINIIDFDYPYWHTLEDTVDKCSAASLGVVGDVVATWTYERRP